MSVTKAMIRALSDMLDAEESDEPDQAEIVCDSGSCWLGFRRIRRDTVLKLLRVMALKDVSDGSSVERYVISSAGREIVLRPALAGEIVAAALRGEPFTVSGGQVVAIQVSGRTS